MTDHPHASATTPMVAQALQAAEARRARHAHVWRMTAAERVAAMYRGELTLGDCLHWAARAPHEVPLLGGEYAFIAIRTPEYEHLLDDAGTTAAAPPAIPVTP